MPSSTPNARRSTSACLRTIMTFITHHPIAVHRDEWYGAVLCTASGVQNSYYSAPLMLAHNIAHSPSFAPTTVPPDPCSVPPSCVSPDPRPRHPGDGESNMSTQPACAIRRGWLMLYPGYFPSLTSSSRGAGNTSTKRESAVSRLYQNRFLAQPHRSTCNLTTATVQYSSLTTILCARLNTGPDSPDRSDRSGRSAVQTVQTVQTFQTD